MMEKEIGERIELGRWMWEKQAGIIAPENSAKLEQWLSEDDAHIRLSEVVNEDIAQYMASAPRSMANVAWRRFVRRYGVAEPRSGFVRWRRYCAAVLFPLLICLAYLYYTRQPGSRDVQPDEYSLVPQRSIPILTLEDGRQIALTATNKELTALENNVRISHDENTIVYTPAVEGSEPGCIHTIEVPSHGDYRMVLSDGTVVAVNSNSKLRFPPLFPDSGREVWLEGEAYFEVAPNPSAPFTVHFGGGSVEVIGTKFVAEAYPDRERSRVSLIEGAVACRTSGGECELRPGSQAVIRNTDGGIDVCDADIRVVTAWLRGQFYFRNERLENIINELSRWYEVDVEYADESLKEQRFTVETNRFDSFAIILDLMKETNRLDYKQQGRVITLYP